MEVNKFSILRKPNLCVFYKPLKHVVIPTLKIDNTELNLVQEFNFFVFFLDKHMSWNKHTKNISSKILQITVLMNNSKIRSQ